MRLWSILKFPFKLINFWWQASQSPFPLFRDKWEVWRVLTGLTIKAAFNKKSNEENHFRIFGFTVYCYKYGTLLYLFHDIFQSNSYRFNYPGKSPLIIDCGANIGMSVLFFKRLYPDSKIMAFEPNPFAYRILEKNIATNNIEDVELYNEALSNTEGSLSFFISEDIGTLHGSLFSDRGGNKSFDVKSSKLSDRLAQLKPDLIKMDVEGAEYDIIEDLQNSGKLSAAGQYIIEYHHLIDGQKPKLAEFLKKFEKEDFRYNLIANFFTLGHFQDVIIIFARSGMGK